MKNYFKLIVLMVPIAGVVVLGFNNCARYGALDDDSGSANLSSSSLDGQVVDSQALGIPYALMSAEQNLQSMMKATNTTTLSGGAMAEYNNRYGALAAGNDLNMANGPMMLGATSLAGAICNDVVDAEVKGAARVLTAGVVFTGGVNGVTDAQYATLIRGLARQFWGRSENSNELAMLMAYKTSFIADEPAASRTAVASAQDLVTSTCAAMLSSVDSITY
ncbi:MAG: hypothetical protein EOP09_11625 [Proteobacteria bacterium]|nr:MAG: hypothetical protein EOP09_11625 [Pseudomonadota bacterium]